MPNKNSNRQPFSNDVINQVWNKAHIVEGYDSTVIRKDRCGAWIRRVSFGMNATSLSMGWEIDHIKPLAKGGSDDLINLQPLQWENNRHKLDSYPEWNCYVTASVEGNIYTKN